MRKGNPKGIQDWNDLTKEGVQVITPQSENLRRHALEIFLAAWGYALKNNLDPKEFVGKLYRNVPVLDSGARASTVTFTERGVGDVLLAWENESYLQFLYTPEGQEIAAKNFYRPRDVGVAAKYKDKFLELAPFYGG